MGVLSYPLKLHVDKPTSISVIKNIIVDLTLGDDEVLVEVKLEPDYLGQAKSQKPVTNQTTKVINNEVARLVGLDDTISSVKEIEYDFLKAMAYRQKGVLHSYVLCVDEDGYLRKNLAKSFITPQMKQLPLPWKSIQRKKDGKELYYIFWKA